MFCSVNYAWRVVRGRCIYKGRIGGGEGAIYARSAATARYLGALRGDSASLKPSHRRDEQKVPEAHVAHASAPAPATAKPTPWRKTPKPRTGTLSSGRRLNVHIICAATIFATGVIKTFA